MINLIKKVEGIVISEIPYHETSKIINVLTKEDGLIGIVAKGAMRPKSPYMGLTSKLTYGYFHINYRDNLSSLIEVDLIDSFRNIKKDLIKMSYSIYLTDLVNQVYKHEQNKEIYSNYIASLIKINEGFDPLVKHHALSSAIEHAFLPILPQDTFQSELLLGTNADSDPAHQLRKLFLIPDATNPKTPAINQSSA